MKRTKFRRTKFHSAEPSTPSNNFVAPVGPIKQSSFSTGRIDETKLPQEYTFFKGRFPNDKAYKLSIEELKKKYLAFLKTKEVGWVVYHGHLTVTTFVTSKEGLNSSIQVLDLIKLEMALTATRHTLYPDQTKKPKLKRTR